MMLNEARQYVAAGLSLVPTRQDKLPALPTWRSLQSRLPRPHEIDSWFSRQGVSVAIIGGKVSGNLNILDFDNKGELFAAWVELVEEEFPRLLERLVVEKSQSGGRHVFYRCREAVIQGNTKLAQRGILVADGTEKEHAGKRYQPRQYGGQYYIIVELIETRGEGGYCLCAPSQGYELLCGKLESVPDLSIEEHEGLVAAARALNEWVAPNEIEQQTQKKPAGADVKPGEDFNARGDVEAVLKKHGWTKVTKNGKYNHWRRPGKKKAWSASLIEGRTFYVFSSNAAPFENEQSYSKFAVYTLLEHQGDYGKAASALYALNYGTRHEKPQPKQPSAPTKQESKLSPSAALVAQFQDEISGKRYACKWPWPATERLSLALLPGSITIIAAPKGSSKSFMLTQCLEHWRSCGYRPAGLMLEEDREFHLRRCLAQRVGNGKLGDPSWVKENSALVLQLSTEHARWLDDIGACIHEGNATTTTKDLLIWLERVAIAGARVIAADPISVRDDQGKPWIDDKLLMTGAKDIAKRYGTSVVFIAHPPKTQSSKDGKQKAWGDDVAGGAALQNLASNIFVLESMAAPTTAKCFRDGIVVPMTINRRLQLRKTRSAQGQGSVIGFHFDPSALTFAEQGIIV